VNLEARRNAGATVVRENVIRREVFMLANVNPEGRAKSMLLESSAVLLLDRSEVSSTALLEYSPATRTLRGRQV